MRYRLIGIDLDGTLLDRRGKVCPENLAAIARARAAGVLVVPCTGRAWRESCRALAGLLPPPEPAEEAIGVFVGGAAVCNLHTGKSLDIAVIEPSLVMELVRALADGREAVLVFRDANLVGYDYLVTGQGSLSANTQWWFETFGATAHFEREVTLADLQHTLRVGIVAPLHRMRPVAARMAERFAGRVLMQHFQAVQMADPEETVNVLEIFAQGVDKWRGLEWIAQQHEIACDEIAVIGDEINDVAMMQAAGCGIAMGNAIPKVKAAARHVTGDCDQAGVAQAIEELLAGRWG